jgi:hypothetical protein
MAKKKVKKQDWEIIDTPYGQWEYPGAITRIPSNDITMQGVPYPVLGVSDTNNIQMMYPNQDYQFDGSSVTEYPLPEAGSGYKVVRSSERKGKTHKVTGPDGTVKFFGDSKLGQHPKDPARKAAFYARHKKNLAGNPYFRAFARKTWEEGGELNEWEIMQEGGDLFQVENKNYPTNFRELENNIMSTPEELSSNLANRVLTGANLSTYGGHNDNKDALRHSGTAMYLTSAQGNWLAPLKVPYTNLLGLFHEAQGLTRKYVNTNSGKTFDNFKQDLKETGSDLYNNFIGSTIGGLPISLDTKEKLLKKAHDNNLLSILEPNLSPEKQRQQSFFERKEIEKNFNERELQNAQTTALRTKFKQVQMPPEMAFGGNLTLEKYKQGGSNWEILPQAQTGRITLDEFRPKPVYSTDSKIQQEILKQQSINDKGSKNNPVSLPEVEIVAKKQLDPAKKAFGTVYPDKTGSSADLFNAMFVAPIGEWAHTPSRAIHYGIGAYKNKDLAFNPYQSEITETLDLKTDPNNPLHSIRNFAINNAADFLAPMTPKLGNWSKELVKGSIKAGRPKLPEFQTVLRAEASGFNPSKVSPSPSLNPVQQGYTGQWLQTASKKNPGAFDEMAAYLTGLETKSGGNMQLLSDVVPWSEAQKFTGKNLPLNAKTMSFGAGEFGTLENALKQGVITKRELALLQNYNSQAARIGSSPNLSKAMNETISKLRQNPKTYNANEMLNASLASRLRLAPKAVGSPELLSKELEAIKNQAMKGYLYAPAVEAVKKGIAKKTLLEPTKPNETSKNGGLVNSNWEIMQEGGNVWEIVSDNEWEII